MSELWSALVMNHYVRLLRQAFPAWDLGRDDDGHWMACRSVTATAEVFVVEPTPMRLGASLHSFTERRRAWLS